MAEESTPERSAIGQWWSDSGPGLVRRVWPIGVLVVVFALAGMARACDSRPGRVQDAADPWVRIVV
jgi:hypothetical protein